MAGPDKVKSMEKSEYADYTYFDQAICPSCNIRTGIKTDEYASVALGEKFETSCGNCGKNVPMINGEPFSQAFWGAYLVIVIFGMIASVFLTFFLKGSITYYCGYMFGLFTLLCWFKYSARKSWDKAVLFAISMSTVLGIFTAFKNLV